MYIVISKPKRKSQAVGVSHFIWIVSVMDLASGGTCCRLSAVFSEAADWNELSRDSRMGAPRKS